MGLIGAEGFFSSHTLAKEIAYVINVEGSGTTGASMILRTFDGNQSILDSLAKYSNKPVGFSMNSEIFKRMPNDTDFSVVMNIYLR